MSNAHLWINPDTMRLEGPDRKRLHTQPRPTEAVDCPGCGTPVEVKFEEDAFGTRMRMYKITGWTCENPDCDVHRA